MTHYLSAEFFRTVRRRYLYFTLGICALLLLSIISLFAYANTTIPADSQKATVDFLFYFFIQFLPTIGLYFTLLVGDMTFSEEHKVQTMRNTVFYGIPRMTIYLGKFLNCLFFCFVVMIVLLAFTLGAGALLLGSSTAFASMMSEFLLMLAGAIPLWIAGAALAVALYSNIPSGNLAAFTFIGIFLLPTNLLKLFAFMLNNKFLSEVRSLFITSRLDELATGAASADPSFLMTCWITGMAFAAVFLIGGYLGFCRKEIK